MAYSDRNLCETMERRVRYETQPCTIPRKKVTALYQRVADEDGDPMYVWDTAHQWNDHAGGLRGGTCVRCGKTLKQVRVRVEPAPRCSSIAAEIARAARDVPPVRFVGVP